MRVDVIVNTTARFHATHPGSLAAVRRAAGSAAEVHATASLDDLARAARALAERGSDLVLLSGGDGSFMAGVTALARAFGEDRLPWIGLLPGGTVATVARNWGMRGDPLDLLRRILAARRDLRATPRPTLRVEATGASGPEERIGFIFGAGLVAKFFELYERDGARGYAGAARIVARIFAESFWDGAYARRVLDPQPCTLEVDGRTLAPAAWSLVCASVVRDLGIHMLVTYRAGEDPDRPHVVASPLPSRALGPRAPRVLAGRSIGGPGHFDDLVGELVVRFPVVEPYVLDGDTLRAQAIRLRAGPILRVVQPPAS